VVVRRINLFGGPGIGKSTIASGMFSEFKRRDLSVELVTEFVKSWASQKREIKKYDQVYLFGKQQHYEYQWLVNGVKIVITDSPTLLSTIYARKYLCEDLADTLRGLDDMYERDFPSVNILLERGDNEYKEDQRYQTYEEAVELDNIIKSELERTDGVEKREVLCFKYNDTDTIMDSVYDIIQ
jgi:nicotinamide riboside kinase